MQEKEIVNYSDIRPALDEEIKQNCRNILEELFSLYEQTNPSGGKRTEKDKNIKATDALMKIGMLAERLTEWAEIHVLGLHHRKHELKGKEIPKGAYNSHKNEIIPYEENVFENSFCACGLCKSCYESSLEIKREALNKILHYTSGSCSPWGWRRLLRDGLVALNNGQVNWIVQPIKTGKKANSFDAMELKKASVKHVYKLIGEGNTKYSAQEFIIEKEYGIKRESLRKWEKELKNEGLLKEEDLENIKNASELLYNNKEKENDIIASAKVAMITSKDANYHEATLFTKNLYYKKPIQPHNLIELPIEISWGVMACLSLERNFPLSDLKERLLYTGISIT